MRALDYNLCYIHIRNCMWETEKECGYVYEFVRSFDRISNSKRWPMKQNRNNSNERKMKKKKKTLNANTNRLCAYISLSRRMLKKRSCDWPLVLHRVQEKCAKSKNTQFDTHLPFTLDACTAKNVFLLPQWCLTILYTILNGYVREYECVEYARFVYCLLHKFSKLNWLQQTIFFFLSLSICLSSFDDCNQAKRITKETYNYDDSNDCALFISFHSIVWISKSYSQYATHITFHRNHTHKKNAIDSRIISEK